MEKLGVLPPTEAERRETVVQDWFSAEASLANALKQAGCKEVYAMEYDEGNLHLFDETQKGVTKIQCNLLLPGRIHYDNFDSIGKALEDKEKADIITMSAPALGGEDNVKKLLQNLKAHTKPKAKIFIGFKPNRYDVSRGNNRYPDVPALERLVEADGTLALKKISCEEAENGLCEPGRLLADTYCDVLVIEKDMTKSQAFKEEMIAFLKERFCDCI